MYRTALIWDDRLPTYRFSPDHPLNPRRLELTLGLIDALGLIDGGHRRLEAPAVATDQDILLAHAPEYVAAVREAGAGGAASAMSQRFGLGSADVPVVPGMHDAAAHVVGATLRAAELVMGGAADRAFSIAGGLHHARRAEAAGFCVYNDLAVAIRWMQRQHNARVLYIDIDAHHGDGVQWIFYDDPDVLTLSFHESGAFLFPGTGFIDEVGEGDGYGYSVNVPLDPNTRDASFIEAAERLLPRIGDAFQPDVIVLQAGCDAHLLDPLTHLRCTTALYPELVRLVGDVADRHCNGRIVATGGGGYAIHSVVPRAWALVWAALCGVDPGSQVPADWLRDAEAEAGTRLPRTLLDPPELSEPTSHTEEADTTNRRTVDAVRTRCLPLVTGWGLGF